MEKQNSISTAINEKFLYGLGVPRGCTSNQLCKSILYEIVY